MIDTAHPGKLSKYLYLLIIPITLCVYWTSLYGDFVSDDWPVIAENPFLRSYEFIPGFFTSGVWANSNIQVQSAPLYRPLYLIWCYAIYSIAGPDPFWFHAALLIVHIFNSLLVYNLLKKICPGSKSWAHFFCALMFALHPAQTQVVAWISGGTDAVMLFFFLTGFLLYIKYISTNKKLYLTVGMAMFSVSLLIKETAAVFPALLILYDLWYRKGRKLLFSKRYAIFFGILLIYLIFRAQIFHGTELTISLEGLPKLTEQFLLTFRYIIFPLDQPFYFNYPSTGIIGSAGIITGICAVLFVSVFFITISETRFGIAWAIITLLPSLLLAFHPNGVFALRFLYAPLVGIAIMLCIIYDLTSQHRPRVVKIVSLGIIIMMTFITSKETSVWSDEKSFYAMVIETDKSSVPGYDGLARYFSRNGNHMDTIATYQLGINNVDDAQGRILLTRKLAQYYANMGLYSKSLSSFEELNRLSPGGTAMLGIANSLYMMGRVDEAMSAYRKAIMIDPENSLLLANFAQINDSYGNKKEAIKYFERILNLPVEKTDQSALEMAKAYLRNVE